MAKRKWKLIGLDFHRWRSGATWGDAAGGHNLILHHGWYSLEWAADPLVDHFRSLRHSFWRRYTED